MLTLVNLIINYRFIKCNNKIKNSIKNKSLTKKCYIFEWFCVWKSFETKKWQYRAKHSVLPQTKAISHLLRKQQTRTFHRLVKGSGLNALVRVTGLEPVRQRHTPLKRACLPIPAHSHIKLGCNLGHNANYYIICFSICQLFFCIFLKYFLFCYFV